MRRPFLKLSLSLLLTGLLGAISPPLEAQTQTALKLEQRQAQIGEDVGIDFILVAAPRGLQRYEAIVTVKDPTVAKIKRAASRTIREQFFRVSQQSESSVRFQGLDFDNAVRPEAKNIILATIVLTGLKAGTTELALDVPTYINEQGTKETPALEPGSLAVITPGAEPPSPPTTGATLLIRSARGTVGQDARVELILGKLTQGLQRFHLRVTSSQAPVAKLKNLEIKALDARFVQVLALSPQAIEFRGVDLRDEIKAGADQLVLAALVLEGLKAGKSALSVEVLAVFDDESKSFALAVQPGEITITAALPPLEASAGPPQDLDGDGLFEDINGDHELNFLDPIVFAFHLENQIVLDNISAFDFNQDRAISFADVLALAALVEAKSKSSRAYSHHPDA